MPDPDIFRCDCGSSVKAAYREKHLSSAGHFKEMNRVERLSRLSPEQVAGTKDDPAVRARAAENLAPVNAARAAARDAAAVDASAIAEPSIDEPPITRPITSEDLANAITALGEEPISDAPDALAELRSRLDEHDFANRFAGETSTAIPGTDLPEYHQARARVASHGVVLGELGPDANVPAQYGDTAAERARLLESIEAEAVDSEDAASNEITKSPLRDGTLHDLAPDVTQADRDRNLALHAAGLARRREQAEAAGKLMTPFHAVAAPMVGDAPPVPANLLEGADHSDRYENVMEEPVGDIAEIVAQRGDRSLSGPDAVTDGSFEPQSPADAAERPLAIANTFDTNEGRSTDDPYSRRAPRQSSNDDDDLAIGDSVKTLDAFWDWMRDPFTRHRMTVSRFYPRRRIIVDRFTSYAPAMKQHVAEKIRCVLAYNATVPEEERIGYVPLLVTQALTDTQVARAMRGEVFKWVENPQAGRVHVEVIDGKPVSVGPR